MSLLRKITFPISVIYAFVVFVRNKLFDIGFFTSERFRTPTICVGNLSVGGTGKTPMVEYVIRYLQDDYKISVLSRGYRRRSKGFVLASPQSTVEDLGDEPYQIHSKFPKVFVAVDGNRRNGISQLEKQVEPDLVLLDDAFQHRKVKADLNFLLTAYHSLYIDDWYLPTGNLRDSRSQAKRADYIIVTKCPSELSLEKRKDIKARLALNAGQKLLFSHLVYSDKLESDQGGMSLVGLRDTSVTLVTGIADPEPLVTFLKAENLSFDHLAFKDHHFFSVEEIKEFNSKDFILTTEKDYMRLQGKVKNIFYIKVSHAFFDDSEKLLEEGLDILMKPNS